MRASEFIVEYKEQKTEEFGGLDFKITPLDAAQSEHAGFIVTALDPTWGKELGYVVFADMGDDELDPRDLSVDDRYQGQGIAKTMYDYVKSLGYTINRSSDQTPAGKGFWDKHRGEETNVWEDSSEEIKLIHTLSWPEVVNKINSAMKAMGWKIGRKGDGAYIFSTKGQETDDQWYMVIIDNVGNDQFNYALGTIEEGDPYIGEKGTLPNTEASISELMISIREGFGLDESVAENFADGKVKGKSRPGRVARAGASCAGSVTDLRAKARKYGGEKGKMYHWCANMKGGKKK
jgi:predicted GNAT family acetyltransferase